MTAPTPEQRAAWKNLQEELRREDLTAIGVSLAVLAPLLPDTLTNPKPELPNAPGRYQDKFGKSGWLLEDSGQWVYNGVLVTPSGLDPHKYAPFTRMVPERPKVTEDQVQHIVGTGTLMSSEIRQLVALANGDAE